MNETSQQLATTTPKAPLPLGSKGVQLESFESLWRFATCIAASPFAPKGMERAEAIVPAIQLGLELGMTPMAALQNVAVINGRPGIYGDAALALVRASGLCDSYEQTIEGEGDARKATVTSARKGSRPITSTFSVADAKKAGLWGKQGPWSQYPDRMLLFRARGFNLRDNFGDVLKGLRTTEELMDIPSEKPANVLPVINTAPQPEPPKLEEPKRTRKPKAEPQPDPEPPTEAPAEPVTEPQSGPTPREQLRMWMEEASYTEPQVMKALRAMNLADKDAVSLDQVDEWKIAAVVADFATLHSTLQKMFA